MKRKRVTNGVDTDAIRELVDEQEAAVVLTERVVPADAKLSQELLAELWSTTIQVLMRETEKRKEEKWEERTILPNLKCWASVNAGATVRVRARARNGKTGGNRPIIPTTPSRMPFTTSIKSETA